MRKTVMLTVGLALLVASTVFAANGDQQKVVVVPLKSSAPAGALPLAWGNISLGYIVSSYNVASASRASTGIYSVTLEKGWSGSPAIIASAFNTNITDEIVTWSYTSPKTVEIYVADGAGNAVDSDVGFVVFGMPE